MISDTNALLTPITFKGAEAISKDLLQVVVDPQSNTLGRNLQLTITALSSGAGAATGYFQYKLIDEKASVKARTSHPIKISDHDTIGKALSLTHRGLSLGVQVYWDASKSVGATLVSNVRKGDEYIFTVQGGSTALFNEGDSNTAHRPVQCSGRGSCDFSTGKCNCLPGFEGSACQRSKFQVFRFSLQFFSKTCVQKHAPTLALDTEYAAHSSACLVT